MSGHDQSNVVPGPDGNVQELEKATRIAAGIVRRQGVVYWPIFVRVEKELKKRKGMADRLAEYE